MAAGSVPSGLRVVSDCCAATAIVSAAIEPTRSANGRTFIIRPSSTGVATTNHQPPTTNHQPPTTNYQLPTTNYQLPTTNYQLPTAAGEPLGSPATASDQKLNVTLNRANLGWTIEVGRSHSPPGPRPAAGAKS